MRLATILMLSLMVSMSACTTNHTDPSRVGWGDLIGPGRARLDRHLDSKRSDLRSRETTIESLNTTLKDQQATLSGLEIDLVAAEGRLDQAKTTHRKILKQIKTNRSKLREINSDIFDLRVEQGKIPSKELVDEVLRLERRVEILKASVTEILLIEVDLSSEG